MEWLTKARTGSSVGGRRDEYGFRIPCSLRRGLPGGVGGARNLINSMFCEHPARSEGARNLVNSMVFEYPARSGGASLDGVGGARNLVISMVFEDPARSGGASLEW